MKKFLWAIMAVATIAMVGCKEKNKPVDPTPTPTPTPTTDTVTVNLNFTEGVYWKDACAEQGWWQVYGYVTKDNKKYFCTLSNAGEIDEAAGTFGVEDLDPDYSFVRIYTETDTTVVDFTDGSCTVAVAANGDVTVDGTFIGTDNAKYVLHFAYVKPVVTETVNLEIDSAFLTDAYVAAYGLYVAGGVDVTTGIYAELYFRASEEGGLTSSMAGLYLYADPTDEESEIDLTEQTLVSMGMSEDESSIIIVASAVSTAGVQYIITLTIYLADDEEEGAGAPRRAARKNIKSIKVLDVVRI